MEIRRISRNVRAMGWVSFLADLASEMLYPIIPLFLSGTLGASPALLGLIEGIAEGVSSGLRWIGGALSDRFGRRKPFVVAGYAIAGLSRPVMGLSAFFLGWPLFLTGRIADRLGKTIRSAARDALIADSTHPAHRGLAFGYHRAMDSAGAILGPLVGLAALFIFPELPLAWLFFLAVIPGVLSALVAALAVREIATAAIPGAAKPPRIFQKYPREFCVLLLGFGVFSLGASSDSFLILRSKEIGLSFTQIIFAYSLYNVVYTLASIPLGRLSDHIGRKPVILAGFSIYAAVYLGFAWFQSEAAPWGLLAVYGLYPALAEGVSKAMVNDLVSPSTRAGALGLFSTVSGLGQLAASLIAGSVWNARLPGGLLPAFVIGAGCALAAIPIIAAVKTPTTYGGDEGPDHLGEP